MTEDAVMRRTEEAINPAIGGVLAPAIRGRLRPGAGPIRQSIEWQKILDAHLAECGNRASCNPDAWREYLPDNN